MITNVFIALGVMMIPIGFLMKTTSVSDIWVWIAGVVGFTSLIWAVFRANKEDKENRQDRQALITEIKGIREDIKNITSNR